MDEVELLSAYEDAQFGLSNPAHKVFFRAGLLACYEPFAVGGVRFAQTGGLIWEKIQGLRDDLWNGMKSRTVASADHGPLKTYHRLLKH